VVDDEDAAKGEGEPDRGGVIDEWRDGAEGAEGARTRGASSLDVDIDVELHRRGGDEGGVAPK
jgi:hypothetical protein